MHLVLIPDKFKGSLSAAQVRTAIEEGVLSRHPGARFRHFAASDGGDGFLQAVRATRKAETCTVPACDPLGREIRAEYLYDADAREAFVEMALASGMVLLPEDQRDPLKTTTRGTGMLIQAAIEKGARTIYVGLGGSATTDAGMGIASEFGYTFRDRDGEILPPVGESLGKVATVDAPGQPLPEDVALVAVNDVSNPLWGPEGAAYVYAPQKGAGPGAVRELDNGLQNLDRVVRSQLGISAGDRPGAGAAGGTAFGLAVFLAARFISGTEYIFRLNGIAEYLDREKADYLVTGEGRIDRQSLQGKLIQGVVRLGAQRQIPVLAVCGSCEADRSELAAAGLTGVIEVADPERSLEWNMEHAHTLIREAMAGYFSQH